jgi:hypothetical protein
LGIKHLSSHLQVILTMFFPDKTIKNLTHNLQRSTNLTQID